MGGPNSGRRRDQAKLWRIEALLAEGLTYHEVGQRLGVTRQAVEAMLRKAKRK